MSDNRSIAKEMAAAGLACTLANGALHGLETTKVKLQLQDPTRPAYNATSPWVVVQQIVRQEGVWNGLVKPGLTTSLTRSTLYGSFRVGLYPQVRDTVVWLSDRTSTSAEQRGPTVFHRLASGMLTGGIGSLLSCPLDVVRTRLQADAGKICYETNIYITGLRTGLPVRYLGMWDALVKIARSEGWKNGLYRGSSVTISRAILLNGTQLASYDTMKSQLTGSDPSKPQRETPLLHVVCALCSGVIAQTAVMPLDTIKASRMMGFSGSTILQRLRQQGPWMLYRGYAPACAGQGIIMVLQMPLVEEFRRLLGVGHI